MKAKLETRHLAVITVIGSILVSTAIVLSAAGAETRERVPISELGIRTDTDDVPGVRGDFCNSWVGYVDDRLVRVVAGFEFKNPLVGTLWITEGRRSGNWVVHTPTSTGPACVVEERNGVLTIQSQTGQFVKEDDNLGISADRDNYAMAPGGHQYRFDLRKETFIK